MGTGKVLGFFGGAILSVVVLGATVWCSLIVFRRRREPGFLWLFIALLAQFAGGILMRVAHSPITIVEYPVKAWFTSAGFYLSVIAPLAALVGWIMLARRKPAEPVARANELTLQ